MKKFFQQEIGVMALTDTTGTLTGVIYKDPKTHKNIFFTCKEMSFDDLKELFDEQK